MKTLSLVAFAALSISAATARACDDEAKHAPGEKHEVVYGKKKTQAEGAITALSVEGMKCGGCARKVTKALEANGFQNVKVDVTAKNAEATCVKGANCDLEAALKTMSEKGLKGARL